MNKINRFLVGAGLCLIGGFAQAAADVTAITATLPDIAAVGTAMFGVYVAIKATKLVRRAL